MGKRIRKCRACGRYTLAAVCPDCGSGTGNPRPASYAPSDPYAAYRREYKRREQPCGKQE